MGRKAGKLKLEFIENQKTRNLTLKRRKEGVMKKAKELNALCDVKLCVILFDPHHDAPSAPVSVWPPNNPALVGGLFNELLAKGSKKNDGEKAQIIRQVAEKRADDAIADQFGETQFGVCPAQLDELKQMDDDAQFGHIFDLENSGPLMKMDEADDELFMFDDDFGPVSDLLDFYHEEAASSSSSPTYCEPQQQFHVVDEAMMMDCSSGFDDFVAQLLQDNSF